MNGLDYIISESNIFKRNKVPLEDIVLAALLHYSGLSLRAYLMEGYHMKLLGNGWYHALKSILKEPEKYRRIITVDKQDKA
ncbi:hypothetical protein HRbin05_00172 [archaeon HR05]|nr:hypothetical protein HRbin05_00172 [archaeon HR05]